MWRDAEVQADWRPEWVRRRPGLMRLAFSSVWLVYLAAPVSSYLDRHPSVAAVTVVSCGLALFVAAYLVALLANVSWRRGRLGVAALGTMIALSLAAALGLGGEWAGLLVYASVAAAVALPERHGGRAILAITALAVVLSLVRGQDAGQAASTAFPTLAAGAATLSFMRLVRANSALRQAREEIARLVVSEERLRFARDLHDLLGHSLSLITLKSELAGRLLPDQPERAAVEVADVERAARAALNEVREAVSGYRRTTLAAELAGARIALDAAGIRSTAAGLDPSGLSPEVEDVLGWTVREGTTNVLRHSRASHCTIRFRRDDHSVAVEIIDDGRGQDGAGDADRAAGPAGGRSGGPAGGGAGL
ncbi:MAG TPA: histidine kinase, partial [Actinomycetota bacterium]|nr:histidine kinase [Actinomycetota bacterium]